MDTEDANDPYKHPLIIRADIYASVAHAAADYWRKEREGPEIDHPREVLAIVASVTDDPQVRAAALLHDTIEKTFTIAADLIKDFGQRVADLVVEVTDVSNPAHRSREYCAAVDREHAANASPEGMTIKLADIIATAPTLIENGPLYAKSHLQEMAQMLEVLKAGDPILWTRAQEAIESSQKKLN